ncbi:dihydrofolate reductase family protein [Polymorphospora sp. NPDC051019]|uniref:dihydrofolate reductase family protein n=1 Tax=Polymorphospora sp. NPDC051019 TaxID=3155725 RepID=UPI003422CE2B
MRKLTYYVAATLDGHIAGPAGEFDFFPLPADLTEAIVARYPETIPGHVRAPLGLADLPNQRFDTVVMGRGTYEPALREGITSPYPHLRQYVVSRTLTNDDPQVTVVADDPVRVVRDLKQQDGLDIWLCGGGKLAATLRDEIDELIIKRNPIVAGAGIPLFDGPFTPTTYTPVETHEFASGVVMTTYTRAT